MAARPQFCLIAAAILLSILSCATSSVPTGTRIKPSHFQYQTVIPPDQDPKGGGWRAVCIAATMMQGMAGGPVVTSGTVCNFEVGLPFRNHRGRISHNRAQRVAANTANDVAYEILTTTQPITGLVCGRFIREFRRQLRVKIPGSEVRTCTPGIRVVPFP